MTNNTQILTDEEIRGIYERGPIGNPGDVWPGARAIESAVLSKLRAAGEPSDDDIQEVMAEFGRPNDDAGTMTYTGDQIVAASRALLSRYAAPQASVEARNAVLEEAEKAVARVPTLNGKFTSGYPMPRPESRSAAAAIAEAIEAIRALKSAPAAEASAKGAGDVAPCDGQACMHCEPGQGCNSHRLGAGDDWRIDHTAGRPILVYQNCSVIEAEQAEYVLRLIKADRQQRGGHVGARHPVVVKWRNNGIEACAGIADAYGMAQAAEDMRAMLTREKDDESAVLLAGNPSSYRPCVERGVVRSVRGGSVSGVAHVEKALREMIEVAERVDGWQSFPIEPIERARAALAAQPVADDAIERALTELVDKIVPGLDTGDLLADARTASKALDRAQPAASAEPSDDVRGEVALRLQERNRHIGIPTARYYVDEVCALLSRYGRPAGDAQPARWLVTGQCGHDEYTRDAGEAHRVKEQRDKSYCGEDETRVVPLYAAPVAAQEADDARDAERYRWLREQRDGDGPAAAVRCLNGPYFNSPIYRERLDAAIDAAISAQQRQGEGGGRD